MKYNLLEADREPFAMIDYTSCALKNEGLEDLINDMLLEVVSGNYHNLICVCEEYIKKANENINDIVQYSIDVENISENMQEKIEKALNDAGIPVIGICWKATWGGNDYYSCKPPKASD